MNFGVFTYKEAETFHRKSKSTKSLKDFQLFIYDMVAKLIENVEDKDVVDSVTFVYEENNPSSAAFYFTPHRTYIELNFAQIKTYKDLIFAFYHEYTHALQHKKLGYKKFLIESKKIAQKAYLVDGHKEYLQHYFEVEADEFAFGIESRMKYKSFVINPSVNFSVFIHRKTIRS
jgi:hypothetical protein